jgi:hypothetical protein
MDSNDGNDLVRAWKDPDERGTTAHPAGEIGLNALVGAGGTFETFNVGTFGCCNDTFVLCSFFISCPPKDPNDPFDF